MEYIENDGRVTRLYDVKIDTERLEDIVRELVEKCYRVTVKNVKVLANSEKEAVDKINAFDSEGIKVNRVVDVINQYEDLRKVTKCPFLYDCEYLCNENTYLVYILQMLLKNYYSTLNFKKQNNRLIDLLIGYSNSDELKSYEERISECKEKMKENYSDTKTIKEELTHLIVERNNNKNFNFELLTKLYNDAKECFNLELVSETIHYKDVDEHFKTYKLGAKRNI